MPSDGVSASRAGIASVCYNRLFRAVLKALCIVLVLCRFGTGKGNYLLSLVDTHDTHTLGNTSHGTNLAACHTNDNAVTGDEHQVVAFVYDLNAADCTVFLVHLVVGKSQTAAGLHTVF